MKQQAVSTDQMPGCEYHTLINGTDFSIRVFHGKKASDSFENLIKKRLFQMAEKHEISGTTEANSDATKSSHNMVKNT